MWDAVRKIFSHDEEPPGNTAATTASPVEAGTVEPPPPAGTPPAAQDGAGDTSGAAPGSTPEQIEETAPDVTPPEASVAATGAEVPPVEVSPVEVSPPGHAPQGLAAEPPTEHIAAPTGSPATDKAAAAPAEVQGQMPGAMSDAAETSAESVAGPTGMETRAGEVPVADSQEPDSQEAVSQEAVSPVAIAAQPASDARDEVAMPPSEPAAPSATAAESAPTAAAVTAPSEGPVAMVDDAPVAVEQVPAPAEEVPTSAEATAGSPTADTDTAVADTSAQTAQEQQAEAPQEAVIAPLAPLAPGAVVAGRYTVTEQVAPGADSTDTLTYHATDARSYERCWSCGSTDNSPSTRFCQNCGAPVQNHPITLVQTREPSGENGEVEQDGAYFHVQPERRLFGAQGMGIEIGAYSAEGPHHPNEDSYWYTTRTLCANSGRQSAAIVVFADGMGGYAPGSGLISARIASTVGESMLAALGARATVSGTLDEAEAEAMMREAIATANEMVLDEIARTGEMGATLVAVMVHGGSAYVANVGDSRAYYVDPHGRTTAITHDQSLVAQEVQQGRLEESDIYTASGNNIILHAVGEPGVEDAADWYMQPLEPGSYLLICSDGYWKTLHGAVMPANVLGGSPTLDAAARGMVDDALMQGSDDNTTVVLIAIT